MNHGGYKERESPFVSCVQCRTTMRLKGIASHFGRHSRGDLIVGEYVKRNLGTVAHGDRSRYKPEHVVIAERAFGGPLPDGAIVHHHDEVKTNNRNNNLVICDRPYHNLIHARMRVFKAGGNPDFHKICCRCQIPRPKAFFGADARYWDKLGMVCRPCKSKSDRAYYLKSSEGRWKTRYPSRLEKQGEHPSVETGEEVGAK